MRQADTCAPTVFRQQRDGTFALMPGAVPRSASAGMLTVDIDADRYMDAFVYSFNDGPSYFLRGGPSGLTPARFGPPFTGEAVTETMGCSAGDVDGDAILDLYCSDFGKQYLLKIDEDGTATDITQSVGAQVMRTHEDEATIAWSTFLLDLDGQHGPDLVSPSGFDAQDAPWDQRLLVLYQRPDGTFEQSEEEPVAYDTHERGLIVADFDGNRCPDLLLLPADLRPPYSPLRLLLGSGCQHPFGATTFLTRLGQEDVGATVIATWSDRSRDAYRVTTSGGYAGTGEALVWLAPRVPGASLTELMVRWTDGTTSTHLPREVQGGTVRQR